MLVDIANKGKHKERKSYKEGQKSCKVFIRLGLGEASGDVIFRLELGEAATTWSPSAREAGATVVAADDSAANEGFGGK